MSKSFLIGDILLGSNQLNLEKWLNIHKQYFYDFFIPILKEKYIKGDIIFIIGNLFYNKLYTHNKIISFALDLFNDFEKLEFNIIIICGENDYVNNTVENSPIRILEKYKNVKIVTEPKLFNFNNKRILLMPYNKSDIQLNTIKNYEADYLYTSTKLKGASLNKNKFLISGIIINEFSKFEKVYSSHIHINQLVDNFRYIGSPYHTDENDYDNIKGIYIIDNDSEEFIPNNITPLFKKIEIENIKDLEKLDSENKNDFIDIIINNSVLKSKEAKRKIEDISKNKKINSIKYIEDDKEDIIYDDTDVFVSTEELIREYIKKQDIKQEDKEKYLKIINDTIKICGMKNLK